MKTKHSKPFVISIVAICLLNIAMYGWFHMVKRIDRGKENVKTPLCKDCNIVLVTMDVCSSRNMPCYGYGRDTTPNLCAFASENQLFLNSFASAPWTYPSHASLMTGLLPTHHGVNIQYQDALSPTIPLLYEELQQNGYETILFQNKESDVTPLDTVYNRGVSVVDESFNVDRIFSRIKDNTKAGKKSFVSYYMAQCHEPNMVGSETKVYTDSTQIYL
jgi:arylsulfatase A-like enzyme